jgi:hypothetical protein
VDGPEPVDEGVFMDDLLREFVTGTNESLDVVDVELVRFEQDPNNATISITFSVSFTRSKVLADFWACPGWRRSHTLPKP